VVVRVDGAAEATRRQGRHDLVDVHVRARARTGLEDIDRELARMPAVDDLLRGRRDRIGKLAVERAGR
jgi:hypothetical protein